MKTQQQIKSRNHMTIERHITCLTVVINVVIPFMLRESNAPQRNTSAKSATNMATFPVYATKNRPRHIIKTVAETPKHTNFRQAQCMCKIVHISHSEESSSDESFCLQLQAQSNQGEGKHIPNTIHLITNLAYCLKPHHTRNMYLRACLDTCAEVNIMPASVYQLVFKDPEMRKVKPCKMQMSSYTADTLKIIGSCTFDIVHLDTKNLVPEKFYVANNDGSILLSYKTTLALH